MNDRPVVIAVSKEAPCPIGHVCTHPATCQKVGVCVEREPKP